MPTTRNIRAHAIAGLLDTLPAGIGTISLDCFDTLIWRTTHAPMDVFAGIDLPGGAMGPRMWSEAAARRIAAHRGGAGEIRLADVYMVANGQSQEENHVSSTSGSRTSCAPRRATPSPSRPSWRSSATRTSAGCASSSSATCI